MTFTTDGPCMVKMEYSDEETSAVLNEARQERKRLRKLGNVMKTVAAYRLKGIETLPSYGKAGYLEEDLRLRS